MDIHHEADHIVANYIQNRDRLRFEFHANGATVIICDATGEHRQEMSHYDLHTLGVKEEFLARLMRFGTTFEF